MLNPSDQFPEIPLNSRRVCMAFQCLETRRVLKKVVFIHLAEDMELEEICERCVLSLKILNGLTTKQLREAVAGTDLKIYFSTE